MAPVFVSVCPVVMVCRVTADDPSPPTTATDESECASFGPLLPVLPALILPLATRTQTQHKHKHALAGCGI